MNAPENSNYKDLDKSSTEKQSLDNTKTIVDDSNKSTEEPKKRNRVDTESLWNEVGFHRIIGGTFYSYILLIVGAIAGIGTVAIIAEFLPFPEINGYKALSTSLLGFWFGLFDLNLGGGGGFSDGMSRFIGQYADTNPRKAVKYIQFYIWFQMLTGLIQVTAIAIIMFTFFRYGNLAYLTWFILAESLVQYPGMLMIMESTLKSFQRGDKTAWLTWLQDTVFQVTVNIVCLVIGKWWGSNNPHIGELMGITIFYILSQFLDDWINLFIGSKMFSNIMKKRGIDHAIRELLSPKFDKAVVKEAFIFTGKQWLGGQIKGFIGYFINLYVIMITPQMASWSGLLLIPNFLGHLVSMVNLTSASVPAISESYNNGKKELCGWRFRLW